MRFFGSDDDYLDLLKRMGIRGQYTNTFGATDYVRFDASAGGVINWWPETGTITFQGPPGAPKQLKEAMLRALGTQQLDTEELDSSNDRTVRQRVMKI